MATVGSTILALADSDPRAQIERPEAALDCALSEFGCDGWLVPERAGVRMRNGDLAGLCPKRQVHSAIAGRSDEASRIIKWFGRRFYDANPGYQAGSAMTVLIFDLRSGRGIPASEAVQPKAQPKAKAAAKA